MIEGDSSNAPNGLLEVGNLPESARDNQGPREGREVKFRHSCRFLSHSWNRQKSGF